MMSSVLVLYADSSWSNTTVPISATGGVRTDYIKNDNLLAGSFNLFKYLKWSFSRQDQETHIRTVLFALSTLETGERAQWYNPETKSGARIHIVMTSPVQGGFCRTFFTEIEIDNESRNYTEKGCRTIDSQFWTFSGR
jgi:hypothetical protein